MRYLHHRDEIPGSAQWQILTDKNEHCWLCDKEAKGFIFWTPGLANFSNKIIQTNDGEKRNIFNELG